MASCLGCFYNCFLFWTIMNRFSIACVTIRVNLCTCECTCVLVPNLHCNCDCILVFLNFVILLLLCTNQHAILPLFWLEAFINRGKIALNRGKIALVNSKGKITKWKREYNLIFWKTWNIVRHSLIRRVRDYKAHAVPITACLLVRVLGRQEETKGTTR